MSISSIGPGVSLDAPVTWREDGEPVQTVRLGSLSLRPAFHTPHTQYAHRKGEPFILLGVYNEPSAEIDAESLPMFDVVFPGGERADVWPDEIFDLPVA